MTVESKGRDLFIVDNSVSGWTGLRYLEEWSSIAKAFDIATGYFEIGGLLALDGKWQGLEKIRILMGAEMTQRTRKALLEAVRKRAVEVLDESIEADKDANPFLDGVPAILEALHVRSDRVPRLRQGQIPRQGLHHPREAGGRRLAGTSWVEQLHRSGPDQEHRAERPDSERPRGRPAPGVV